MSIDSAVLDNELVEMLEFYHQLAQLDLLPSYEPTAT